MTQQNTYNSEDNVYKKRIFYDNGLKFVEVKGRIVMDYKPPTPVMKSHANSTIQSPSGLIQGGTAHYTMTLTMLFYSKKEFADWLQFIGAEHRFYDEKGSIYTGIVNGEPDIRTVEQESKYLVSVNFLLVRKSEFEFRHQAPYVDLGGHWSEQYVTDLQEKGLITVYDYNGDAIQYFRPEEHLIRSEAAAFLLRTFRHLDKLLRGY
ncbi:S-layer homology domain-containing protein [Brevibacillus laterosporus]|uniref:S-layer homology domain-containing protein n=1 Tax=Brevibacillus laterosporus TaxID=1465 RepID=UPI003D1CAF80